MAFLESGNKFLDTTPKKGTIPEKKKIGKLYFLESKTSALRQKQTVTDWEKIFANDISHKGPLSKIYKECLKLNSKRTNNLIKK